MGHTDEFDGLLRTIEAAAAAIDAGDQAAARQAAEALLSVFQPPAGATSILSRLGGTYVKIVSAVSKPPYPQGKFAPLTDVLVDLNSVGAATGQAAGFPPPTFRPRLGPTRNLRTVQAPDWWKSEPVFLVDHSKATRRDVVQTAAYASDAAASHLADLLTRAGWTGMSTSAFAEYTQHVPVRAAASAAVRQIVHEVLNSPEVLKLAGRNGKP